MHASNLEFFVSRGALVGRRGGEDYGDHCVHAPPNFNVGRRGVLALAALAGVPLLCSVGTTRKEIVRRLNIEIGGCRGERGSAANHRTKSCVAFWRSRPSMRVPFVEMFSTYFLRTMDPTKTCFPRLDESKTAAFSDRLHPLQGRPPRAEAAWGDAPYEIDIQSARTCRDRCHTTAGGGGSPNPKFLFGGVDS